MGCDGMSEKNTLRQVRHGDLYWLKQIMETTFNFYILNCERISELAEVFQEDESDTWQGVLTRGLNSFEDAAEIIKEAKRGDQL